MSPHAAAISGPRLEPYRVLAGVFRAPLELFPESSPGPESATGRILPGGSAQQDSWFLPIFRLGYR